MIGLLLRAPDEAKETAIVSAGSEMKEDGGV